MVIVTPVHWRVVLNSSRRRVVLSSSRRCVGAPHRTLSVAHDTHAQNAMIIPVVLVSTLSFSLPVRHVAFWKPTVTPRLAADAQMALPLTEAAACIFAASGALSWVSPETKMSGLKQYDDAASKIVRAVGAWQLALAAVLLTGPYGATVAAGRGMYIAALTQLSVLPVWDSIGREKGSQVGAILLFTILGRLTLGGHVSPIVSAAVYVLTGTLIYFTPKATAELYQLNTPLSELAYSMMSLYGGVIATTGIYLAGLACGLAQPRCLAAAFATNAFFSLKLAATEAGKAGK